MDIATLYEQRNALADERKELLETAESEKRDLTEEDAARFDACTKEIESLTARIKRAESVGAEQEQLASTSRTTQMKPRVEVGHDLLADDPCGGFGSDATEAQVELALGQFAHDVFNAKGGPSDRLAKWDRAWRGFAAGDGMTTMIGHEGAYLLPKAFGSLVDRIALENAVVRPRATKVAMSAKSISFPVLDDTDHSGNTVFGGIQAYWKSEESQLTSTKAQFADMELTLHRLTALAYVTNELLDWSPVSLGSWLPTKLAAAIAWKEDDKFINGNGGSGEPVGVINAMAKTEIAKETGQAAKTIVFENIVNMDAQLWDASGRGSVVWIANRTCKKQLPKLKIDVGTGGMPIYLPADGAAGRPLSTLYGYPIVFTEHAQALGTAGDIMLCNLGEYLVGDASGKTRSDRDMGLKFDYDQTAFRVVTYTGGLCPWRAAFTPQNGDDLSPVLTLAARA